MPKTIVATVKKRISLGGTDYLYMGELTPDTEYETGGDTIVKPEGVGVLTLPEKIDFFDIINSGGYVARYNPATGKVQIFYTGAAVSTPLAEIAAKANLSAISFSYICVGC
jgi:hypothetical protein